MMETRHDVFLSFRGEDTRNGFMDHLDRALRYSGLSTFRRDDGEDEIQPETERCIKESSISAIVFSERYASSKGCLDELRMIINRIKSDVGYIVFPIFYHVQPMEVGYQKGSFKQPFDNYEATAEHSKEKIDEWRKALKEASKLAGIVLQDESNQHEAVFIQSIVKELGNLLKRKFLSVPSYTVGVDSQLKDIGLWVKDPGDLVLAGMYGLGGCGKTVLAQVVYNSFFADFEASCFLVNVREASEKPYGLLGLQSQLLSDISKRRKRKIYDIDEGIVKIQDAIRGKRVLIILDNVYQIEHVDALVGAGDSFLKGSKIIITTSRERLLSHQKHKTFTIKPLDYHESLELFSSHAFLQDRPKEGYLELSERIVRHCVGLPLALHVMGSSLFGKNLDFWASALEKLEAIPDERIRKTLELSYKSLHDHNKLLFLMISLSFVGEDIDVAINMLEESDFYSKVGMQNLIDKSLITVDKDNRLIMHQLVRDMARAIIRQDGLGPGKHNFYNLIGAKTDTITTEPSLLSKNDDTGKRKRVEDY